MTTVEFKNNMKMESIEPIDKTLIKQDNLPSQNSYELDELMEKAGS